MSIQSSMMASFKQRITGVEVSVYLLGVVSIMPNLDGILFQTENDHGYMLERHDLTRETTGNYANVTLSYPTQTEIYRILKSYGKEPFVVVHDRRDLQLHEDISHE